MPAIDKPGEATKKAMALGTISYLESQGLPVNKSAIFRHFSLSRSQGYAALSPAAATPSKRGDPEWVETRGRPSKISEADQRKMEAILWDEASAKMNLNWEGLARMAGVEAACNPRTLHRAMGTLSYRMCLYCTKSCVQKKSREKRVEYARRMLEVLPLAQDWHDVRFSGELHFGFGLNGKVRLIPRPGEGCCAQCSSAQRTEWTRDVKRVHVWAAAGYGFKSQLVFYEDDLSANNAGLLSMNVYRDKVLDKVVKRWLMSGSAEGGGFTLEEDADAFAHGGASKSNVVQEWKEANGLRSHFGCPESPDLGLLDCIWPAGKEFVLEQPLRDWEGDTLRQAVKTIWDGVEMEKINVWTVLMVERLRSCVAMKGDMVRW
jgi:hypothetical protein